MSEWIEIRDSENGTVTIGTLTGVGFTGARKGTTKHGGPVCGGCSKSEEGVNSLTLMGDGRKEELIMTKGGKRMPNEISVYGAVRWREDIKKYVIDFYDNLGKRHVETIGTNKHEAEDKLWRR